MRQHGRKSGAQLSIVPNVVAAPTPPPPPRGLTTSERRTWADAIASMPGRHWFQPGMRPLLIAYCRHCSRAKVLDDEINRLPPENIEEFLRLAAAAREETKAILSLARSLRLTPQSRVDPIAAGRRIMDLVPGRKPWEAST